MALFDSADLLARFELKAGIPSVRSFPTDPNIYSWLTDANVKWHNVISQHAPYSQYGALVKLTTADDGETYTFPSGVYPIGSLEVYEKPVRGRLLKPGAFWDTNSDYTNEGNKIRIPSGKSTTFSDGPYARYMADAAEISANSEPVLQPTSVNLLLVYTACAYWASRGGMKDPKPFLRDAQDLWIGDQETDFGILGMLKTQHAFQGLESFAQGGDTLLGSVDSGAGYQPL